MHFQKECFGPSFKIWATISTGLVAGGSLYISLVEGPARMTHEPSIAAEMFHSIVPRTKKVIGSLSILTAVCSAGAYVCTRGRSDTAIEWLLAESLVVLTIPFARYFILPLNDAIMDSEKCNEKGDNWIVSKLSEWNKYHGVRSVLNLTAFSYMVFLLARRK